MNRIFVVSVALCLSGCASSPSRIADETLSKNNHGSAVVQRENGLASRPKPRAECLTEAKTKARYDRAGNLSVRPILYDVQTVSRSMSGGLSYSFTLELMHGVESSIKTIKAIKQDFRKALRDDYTESFSGLASAGTVFIEFPEFMFEAGKISGRAVVMSMTIISMKYDPLTRTGHLAVKMNDGHFSETRRYIRRNIERLVRDKNIALKTGEVPPAAKFYLGREKLKDGNILEIEFRTE